MTKPRDLTTTEFFALPIAEFFALPIAERRAHSAEWDAWTASPEGQAEARAYQERRQAAFEAKRLELAEQMFRGTEYSRHCERLDLPARAVDVVLSGHMDDTPAVTAARGCTDILVLSGGVGTSKTVAGTARVHEYIFDPANWNTYDADRYETEPRFRAELPVWISASELARVDHFSTLAVDRFKDAPLLVIDDLFSEYLDAKGFLQSLLDEIVDARYAGKLPTIITTNCNAAGFAERYGKRIIDRLREGGRFFACGATSLRGRAST